MKNPTITFREAIYWFSKKKRRPRKCGHCIMTCVHCWNLKYIDKNGKVKPQGWSGPVNCAECRVSPYRRRPRCFLLDKDVHANDKPICTKFDVNKALIEAI